MKTRKTIISLIVLAGLVFALGSLAAVVEARAASDIVPATQPAGPNGSPTMTAIGCGLILILGVGVALAKPPRHVKKHA